VLVALPETTPVNEMIETAFALEDRVGVRLGPVVVNGDRWNHVSRLIVACALEKPALLDDVDLVDLAGGPTRDLAAIMRRRLAAGLAADTAALKRVPEVEALGSLAAKDKLRWQMTGLTGIADGMGRRGTQLAGFLNKPPQSKAAEEATAFLSTGRALAREPEKGSAEPPRRGSTASTASTSSPRRSRRWRSPRT